MTSDRDLALTKHAYVVKPGGEPQVNITAISKLLDIDGKSSAFAGAAVKLTKEGKNYREEWRESGELGTRVHGYCESFLRGEAIEMRNDEKGYVDALEQFLVEMDPINIIPPEFVVISSHGYGGRGDMLVDINGERALIDLKSGKRYAIEHTLQLAALRYAEFAVYDDEGMLTGTELMPDVDYTACLYVANDGSYELVRYPADRDAHWIFISLLDAYKWTRKPEIKALTDAWKKKK